MSLATLYKNRDLWHPDFISPGDEDGLDTAMSGECAEESASPDDYRSLLDKQRCNCPERTGDLGFQVLEEGDVTGGESCNAEGGALTSDGEIAQGRCAGETVAETIARVRRLLQGQRQQQEGDEFSVDTS